jgi:hypothetical protein
MCEGVRPESDSSEGSCGTKGHGCSFIKSCSIESYSIKSCSSHTKSVLKAGAAPKASIPPKASAPVKAVVPKNAVMPFVPKAGVLRIGTRLKRSST